MDLSMETRLDIGVGWNFFDKVFKVKKSFRCRWTGSALPRRGAKSYKRTFAVKTALSTPCCSSLDKKCEQRGWIPGVKRNKRKRRREALAMPNARTTCSCATFIPSSLEFWDHSSRSKSHPPSLNNGTFYSFKLFLLVINPSEKLNHFIWRKKKKKYLNSLYNIAKSSRIMD